MASYKTTVSSRSLSHNHSILTCDDASSEAPIANPCTQRLDSDNIPQEMSTAERCCCGRPDCAYLAQNTQALNYLERNLKEAAKLGNVCPAHSFYRMLA